MSSSAEENSPQTENGGPGKLEENQKTRLGNTISMKL